MIAPRRYYSTEIELMISSMTREFLDLFELDISGDSYEMIIWSEESLFPEICHLIISFSWLFSEDSYEYCLLRGEDLERTSTTRLPVLEWLCIMVESDDIVLRIHTHRDHIGHDIHIHRIMWKNPNLKIKILSILSQERIDRVWREIPGFTHREWSYR